MAWNTTLVTMLRAIIGDLDITNYTYSDFRLQQLLLVSAQLVSTDIHAGSTPIYTIDMDALTLSPDPTSTDTLDNFFIGLTTLKAACILDTSELRAKATSGMKLVDGRSSIDTTPGMDGFVNIIKMGACKAYTELKDSYFASDGYAVGQAILTPFAIFSQGGGRNFPGYHADRSTYFQ